MNLHGGVTDELVVALGIAVGVGVTQGSVKGRRFEIFGELRKTGCLLLKKIEVKKSLHQHIAHHLRAAFAGCEHPESFMTPSRRGLSLISDYGRSV